ncbi:MAG: hypothetical protein VX737_05980 [Pseudomonadota bacterium]|nr:hypothetical protein [Pseudomonadota bacterium]
MKISSYLYTLLSFIVIVFSFFTAFVEVFSVWNLINIFIGRDLAYLVSAIVFQFAVSDAFCVYESFFNAIQQMLSLFFSETTSVVFLWIFLYALAIYASFSILLQYSFMHVAFQTSLFFYVYMPELYLVIPFLVNLLIQPMVLTVTLNAFNKICDCILMLRNKIMVIQPSKEHESVYRFSITLLNYSLCMLLTLNFSEALYVSLKDGVLHYKLMYNSVLSFNHLQETLLLVAIALSTFRTMSAVADNFIAFLVSPYHKVHKFILDFKKVTLYERMIYGWGYFTVLCRSIVRGLQTSSYGSGFRQVTVSYIDKSRRNAFAYLILRKKPMSLNVSKKEEVDKEKNQTPYLEKVCKELTSKLRLL